MRWHALCCQSLVIFSKGDEGPRFGQPFPANINCTVQCTSPHKTQSKFDGNHSYCPLFPFGTPRGCPTASDPPELPRPEQNHSILTTASLFSENAKEHPCLIDWAAVIHTVKYLYIAMATSGYSNPLAPPSVNIEYWILIDEFTRITTVCHGHSLTGLLK
jgi:hypothetical protein